MLEQLQEPEFWVAVAFVILMAIFWKLGVHRTVVASLDDRGKRIQGELDEARRLKEEAQKLLAEYQGVFIATPEYNSSIPALLKNTIDWVTRVRAKGETGLEVYKTRVFAISGASPGYYGAMRSLLTLRQILEVGVGATVIPQQLALPRANDAFEADGSLKDKAQQTMLKDVVEKLAIAAKRFAA